MEKKQTDAFRTTEYIDGFQYKTETGIAGGTIGLQFFATSEGYFDFVNNRYIYQYVDHLGNVRLSFTREGGEAIMVEKADYYAFGLKHNGTVGDRSSANYNYEYNGKELQEETGMYDYGARFYMPDLGRWGVVDPLAETSRRFTPYHYGNNNPMRFIDPDGRSAETFTGQDAQNAYWHFYFGGSMSNFSGTHSFGSFGGNQNNNLSANFSYFDAGSSGGGGGGSSLSPWMQNYLNSPPDDHFNQFGKFLYTDNKDSNNIVIDFQNPITGSLNTSPWLSRLLTDIDFSISNNVTMLNNITFYYALKAGVSTSSFLNGQISTYNVFDMKFHGAILDTYGKSVTNGGTHAMQYVKGALIIPIMHISKNGNITIDFQNGKIDPLLGDKYNFMSVITHERGH